MLSQSPCHPDKAQGPQMKKQAMFVPFHPPPIRCSGPNDQIHAQHAEPKEGKE